MTAHLLPLYAARHAIAPSKSSHCSALAKQPFSGAPASRIYSTSDAYQIRQLTNGRAGWPTEICIKRGHFRKLPLLKFSVIFLHCNANARVYDATSGHGPHSPPPGAAASPKRLKKVENLQYATGPVWAQNPDWPSRKPTVCD